MHFTREIIVHPSILTSPTLDPWVAHSMTILLNGEFPPPALFSQSESLIQTLTLTLRSSPSRGWKRGRGTGGQRAKKGGGRTPASQWFWQQKINVGDAFPPTFTNVTKGEQKMAMKLVLGDEWSVTPFYTCCCSYSYKVNRIFFFFPLLLITAKRQKVLVFGSWRYSLFDLWFEIGNFFSYHSGKEMGYENLHLVKLFGVLMSTFTKITPKK